MTTKVVSVAPQTTLIEVQRLLESHSISAVPVLSADGQIMGVVSARDLLHRARVEMDEQRAVLRVAPSEHARAEDVMHRGAFTVEAAATIEQAAATMLERGVHRLIVTEREKLIGVLSTRDVMQAVVARGDKTPLGEFMTTPVAAIEVGTPSDEAARRLDASNVRGLVVVDGTWPIGVFTHTEALAATKLPVALRAIAVERLMSYETICLDVEAPAHRVASYARQLGVRRILAVSRRDLVGIATGIDLLKLLVQPK